MIKCPACDGPQALGRDCATCLGDAPVAYPEDGKDYTWDEETTSWVAVPE